MTKLAYRYDDGGRAAAGFKGSTGDCVTRAVAIASGRPYAEVYAALSTGMGTQRRSKHTKRRSATARDGINVRRLWFKDYMHGLGAEWVTCMTIGSGCKVHLLKDELPPGRLVVSVSKHYTAVIDHVIRDTHDPSADRGTMIYSKEWLAQGGVLPKGARWLENGNGWAYAPDRCVYGYWRFP